MPIGLGDSAVADVASLLEAGRLGLEWPDLLELVAGCCRNELSAKRLRELRPAPTFVEAVARMVLTRQAVALHRAGTPLPTNDVIDLGPLLVQIEHGQVPSRGSLFALLGCLRAARALRRFLLKQEQAATELREALPFDPGLGPFVDTLDRCFTDEGELSDRASPGLRAARRDRDRERDRLQAILLRCRQQNSSILQGDYVAERDGRYVLPVRSDAEHRLDGLVLGASGSGQTLYIAPKETLEPANALAEAEARVLREEAAVLSQLGAEACLLLDGIRRAFDGCLRANELSAFAVFAERVGAEPIPVSDSGKILLKEARHPLLVDRVAPNKGAAHGTEGTGSVVPNDISLECGQALMISGPNAGGKTVALKCLGLAALMAASGIPAVARADSEIGFFGNVLVDIGDHQSLRQSLSSFTAHLARTRRYLELADRQALILIDEVASGTDPLEGAALARALLEAFTERGAAIAVTTHYELLKELGASGGNRYVNASVGFDFENLQPTYRLNVGVPGVSSALTVAEISGVPKDIVERARELVPETARREGDLLRRLEEERQTLERLRQELAADQQQQRALVGELERKRVGFEAQERERLAREAREITREVEQARQRLREAKAQLENQSDAAGHAFAERMITEAAHAVSIGGRLTRAVRAKEQRPEVVERAPSAEDLPVGRRVHYPELGVDVEVLRAPLKGRVRVAAGNLQLQVALEDLRIKAAVKQASVQRSAQQTPAHRVQPSQTAASTAQPIRTLETTCDLRGLFVEDALTRVDDLIDALLRTSEPGGFVLHGHGTGALKQAVRQHLRTHAHIAKHAPAERDDGGDALTVFWLKG